MHGFVAFVFFVQSEAAHLSMGVNVLTLNKYMINGYTNVQKVIFQIFCDISIMLVISFYYTFSEIWA